MTAVTTEPTRLTQASDLDKLAKSFASTKLEDNLIESEEQPESSKRTPESGKFENLTKDGRRNLYVASKSKVKPIAAVIARNLRNVDKKPPVLSAVGASSVNQAIKAIAVSRIYVASNDMHIGVRVERTPKNGVRDLMSLTLERVDSKISEILKEAESNKENNKEQDNYVEMRSAASSTPNSLAGALAANIREDKHIRITAIGSSAVFKAIKAISVARHFVKKDGKDLLLIPQFTEVSFENGKKANGLQLIVLANN